MKSTITRTKFNQPLKCSKKTRMLFKQLQNAKQKRSKVRIANELVKELNLDAWSCPHLTGRERQTLSPQELYKVCDCIGGGMVGHPEVKIEPLRKGLLGLYCRAIAKDRYDITISPHADFIPTFIHELTHWLDDDVDIGSRCGAHTKSFYARMADLQKRLTR